MIRRITACLIILAILTSCAALGEGTADTADHDSLTVGSTTQMRGEFFTEAWGNATSDYDVKALLHGYNLIRWDTENSIFKADESVVSGLTVGENEAHDRTYILVFHHDLYYSDGTQITAWDYAFSLLLMMSPEVRTLGASAGNYRHILGSDAYMAGESRYLSGVRVTADDTIAITVHHDYFPYFYELSLLLCNPYPIHVIAPGVAVRSDDNGVFLDNSDQSLTEPVFTAELLSRTLNDPDTGYRSHPSVVSGPFTLASWDGTTAEFEINPFFKGDYEGKRPLIPHLAYTLVSNETMMDDLDSGRVDLLNKVMNANAIQQGIGMVGAGSVQMSNYPRLGLGYISFCCEKPAVAGEAIRQAIAWCMDRDQLVSEYTGSFGVRSDGYYGLGQWVYGILAGNTALPVEEPEDSNDANAVAAYNAEIEQWESLSLENLTVYNANPEKARQLLEQDGWRINDQGVRQKEINGETVQLDLTLVYPAGSTIADSLNTCLIQNLELVGIRLNLVAAEMPDLLAMYYRLSPRSCDMFFLASNFDLVFDPSTGFTAEDGVFTWRNTAYADEKLYDLAADMRKTTPGDLLSYCRKWIAFQEYFNETLPLIPLYTNVYFDFYTPSLRDYNITETVTWSQALLGASLSDGQDEESGDEF